MSDPSADSDKIRNKRLAKLAGQSSASSSEASQPSNSSSQPTPQAGSSPDTKNAFSDSGPNNQDAPQKPPSISIKPTTASSTSAESATPIKRDSRDQARSRTHQAIRESPESWEDKTLAALFRISLDPEKKKDVHGNPLYFLPSLHQDLQDSGSELKLRTSEPANLEDAIVEVASNQGAVKPLHYLLECWKRITRLLRSQRNNNVEQKRQDVVLEAKRLCMSYCIFSVTMPALLGQEDSPTSILTQHLLVDPDSDRGICHEFLAEAVSRFPEDENVKSAMVSAAEEMSKDLSKLSMNDNYRPYLSALANLVSFKPMVEALAQSSHFLPSNTPAQSIETDTLLGPFFRLSPLQGEVALNYFSSPRTRDPGYIANSQNALRMTLQQHQTSLFEIVDRFVRAGPEPREKMLDWLAFTVNSNHKRRAMRTDPRYVSSDGFMVNVTVCLDRLSEPFIDNTFSKIHRIEVEYLRRSPRVQIKDETKINADQATSDKFYEQQLEGQNNFISEIFFLTAAAHHYGTEAAQTKLGELRRELRHMEQQIERFEQERDRYAQSPQALALFDTRLKQVKEKLDEGHCVMMATEGVLLDETLQSRAMAFMRYVIVWMMRMVSNVDFPKQSLQLPLSPEQPDVFKCLPEYFFEDVVDHFKFVTNHMPRVITASQCEELVMFCVTFLESSEYIKNPGVKAGLVIILYHGIWATRTATNGVLGGLLNTMPFALKNLLHALMKSFIECESTGAHTQFYDKFSTRFEIFRVIQCIWGNFTYRQQLENEAKLNVDFFVRFVNLLLNDATFLLDESFQAFQKINALTKELGEGRLDETAQNEKKEALEEAKSKAKNYMGLTLENLSMLKLFTDALADSFTMPEIVQRLAYMLNYNLDALVGPKQTNLKVKDAHEYRFDPLSMLSDLTDVYLNLAAKQTFRLAIAKDGRSYKPENFKKAAKILEDHNRKSAQELQRWRKFCEAVEIAKAEDEAEEENLGEIPDEFLDPLLATLMTDPVILPTSKHTVDRSTIRQMLLSDAHDPFNRAPLKMEDVVPDLELKARIEAFRADKRAQKTNGDAMDTGEG